MQRGGIKQRKRDLFRWTPEFVSVKLFKVKKYPKTRKVLKVFESERENPGNKVVLPILSSRKLKKP